MFLYISVTALAGRPAKAVTIRVPLLVNEPEVKAIGERLSQSQGKTVPAAQVILAWSQIAAHSVIPKSVTP